MNNSHVMELLAVEKYHSLQAKYNELVSGYKDRDDLSIINRETNCLVIDAIGHKVAISFSMVSDGNDMPSFEGQINVDLIKNTGTPQETRTNLFTHWYDDLGNVRKDYNSKTSLLSTKNAACRDDIFYSIIRCLLKSKEMRPVNVRIDYGKMQ
jgi:hypothetical protein